MTKDEALKCNDGQKLADAVAVECMGWTETNHGGSKGWFNNTSLIIDDWQPHLPTEKGKAQCFDLMTELRPQVITNGDQFVLWLEQDSAKDAGWKDFFSVAEKNLQIGILKLRLLSQLGEGDE